MQDLLGQFFRRAQTQASSTAHCLMACTVAARVAGQSDNVATFAQPPGPVCGTAWWGTRDVTQLGTNESLQLLVSQLSCCGKGQEEVGCCILFILTVKNRAGIRKWFN